MCSFVIDQSNSNIIYIYILFSKQLNAFHAFFDSNCYPETLRLDIKFDFTLIILVMCSEK